MSLILNHDSQVREQKLTQGLLPPKACVEQLFAGALQKAFPDLPEEAWQPSISTSNPQFGDYQCNNAMSLFKLYKSRLGCGSPKEIADRIGDALDRNVLSSVDVARQGFITVKLHEEWLINQVAPIVANDIRCKAHEPLSVAVDYSSPNIAKEMHVGHLRSTIHGEAVCRILEFVGHTVLRINHLGDWGTQFGMLIAHLQETHPDFQTNPLPLSDLNNLYRESKVRFDKEPGFKDKARSKVVQLQAGDKDARVAWQLLVDTSMKEFQVIYDLLGVSLVPRGESFYNELIPKVISMCEKQGIVTVSEGAKCVFVESDPQKRENEVPLMLQKSDGGFGYDSTDMAAIYHRFLIERHDWLIYITDVGQSDHCIKLFDAAKLMDWHKPPQTRADHIGLGFICSEDGKKFKTRSGEVVKLIDLLEEASQRAKEELATRWDSSSNEENLPHQFSLDVAARRIGLAAVKYFDLKQERTHAYKFSYAKMLDPKGNTAVYLLYAYARISAIFRKAGRKPEEMTGKVVISEPEERAVIICLVRFPEILEMILRDFSCHRLCDFVYTLTTTFTDFYQKCRVVGHDQEESRLLLCAAVKNILDVSFNLLGIESLPRI